MTVVPSPDFDLVDRKYLSQFATDAVGMALQNSSGLVDPDGSAMTVSMTSDLTPFPVIFSRPAARQDVGTYMETLTAADTSIPGPYTIRFDYTLGGTADYYDLRFVVGSSAPDYDALPWGLKQSVEQVWIRFADLYDSPTGGPHLQIYLQSKFGRNRVAQLLKQAVGRLNTLAFPHGAYAADGSFPLAVWGSLMEQILYVEVVKHLRRSYVEIPDVILGTTISRTERRDYLDRWGVILADEQADLALMIDNFKMAHMGLGNVSVLVSGGAYGNFGPVAPIAGGSAAARGYFVAHRVF